MTTTTFVIDRIIIEYPDPLRAHPDETATSAALTGLAPSGQRVHSTGPDLPVMLAVGIAGDRPGCYCLHLKFAPTGPNGDDDRRWAPDPLAHLNTRPDGYAATQPPSQPGAHAPSATLDLPCSCRTCQGDNLLRQQQATLPDYPLTTTSPVPWHPRIAWHRPKPSPRHASRAAGETPTAAGPVAVVRPGGRRRPSLRSLSGSTPTTTTARPPSTRWLPRPNHHRPPGVGTDTANGSAHSRRGLLGAGLVAAIVLWGVAAAVSSPSRPLPPTRPQTASVDTAVAGGVSSRPVHPPICDRLPQREPCPTTNTTPRTLSAADRRALTIGARALGVDVDTFTAMVLADHTPPTPTVRRSVVDRLDERRAQAADALARLDLGAGGAFQAAADVGAELNLLNLEQAIAAIDLPDLASSNS